MDILDMLGIEHRIRQAQKESPQERYARIDLDLGAAENVGKDIKIPISGDYLAKIKYDGSATGCYFKFGNKRSSIIYAAEFRKRHTPFVEFDAIYLTNTAAQTGKHFILFVGGAFAGEIEPSTGIKTGLTDADGVDIDPLQEDTFDKRFIAHTGGHIKVTLATLDTAQQITASSTKVKWAIISSHAFPFRWGFSDAIKQSTAIGQYIAAGSFLAVEYCDLSEIYFVDADASNKPILQIEYILEAT